MTSDRTSRWLRAGTILLAAAAMGCVTGTGIATTRAYQDPPPDATAVREKDGRMAFRLPQGWKVEDPRAVLPGVAGEIQWLGFAFTRSSEVLAFRKGEKGIFAIWCDNPTGNSLWTERVDNRVKAEAPFSVQAEAIQIESRAKGSTPYLFRFDSEVVREGARVKAPFTLYNGHKGRGAFDPHGCEYMFYGKAISNEHRQEIEGDFIVVLRSIEVP